MICYDTVQRMKARLKTKNAAAFFPFVSNAKEKLEADNLVLKVLVTFNRS